MPCRPRTHLGNMPLHIVQRGHNREPYFFDEKDYYTYLEWMRITCLRLLVALLRPLGVQIRMAFRSYRHVAYAHRLFGEGLGKILVDRCSRQSERSTISIGVGIGDFAHPSHAHGRHAHGTRMAAGIDDAAA